MESVTLTPLKTCHRLISTVDAPAFGVNQRETRPDIGRPLFFDSRTGQSINFVTRKTRFLTQVRDAKASLILLTFIHSYVAAAREMVSGHIVWK